MVEYETKKITEEQYNRFRPDGSGARPTSRVCEHPDLQEWCEPGKIDGRKVMLFHIFDGEPGDCEFEWFNFDRVEFESQGE